MIKFDFSDIKKRVFKQVLWWPNLIKTSNRDYSNINVLILKHVNSEG